MKRWVYFFICLFLSGVVLMCGWLMPIHLRAVDASVLQKAGEKKTGLIEHGLAFVREKRPGPAEMLLQAAQQEKIPGQEKLRAAVENSARTHPERQTLGMDPLLKVFSDFAEKNSADKRELRRPKKEPVAALHHSEPFTGLIIQSDKREKTLGFLRSSPNPVVQQLMRCRALTNTVLFPPSQSSSGQAFDAALSTGGLLLEGQHLAGSLTNAIFSTASAALRGENSQPLEQILLDFMSLGQRFDWGQLVTFCEKIDAAETLRQLANLARKNEAQLPILFSAVELSGNPEAVTKYLMSFGQTGQKDLAASLHFGAGGVNELLSRNQRLHHANFQGKLNGFSRPFVYLAWQMPKLALGLKWLLYLAAGYLLALALHFAMPRTPIAERPFQARGFHVAREILFALGFLVALLLVSEPYLAQENQNVEFPIRIRLPMAGDLAPVKNTGTHGTIMNQLSILTLLLFFVLQALLYIACLFKLAEIRRQTFPANIKLKLLENEEHLFDAGLYLGFAGTIISLILVSMGVIKPSLMAAYSSTSFGVIFVSFFKIFNLRPLRRKLLIETESAKNLATAPAPNPISTPL